MRIKRVKEFVRRLLKTKLVPMLWGPPGIGKSSIIKQIANEEDKQLIDLRLSLIDAIDLRGLPRFDEHRVVWARPEFIPQDGEGILFLDEINTALPIVQNAALQLVYDRRTGTHRIGEEWSIVCAGNRKTDLASVFHLSSAMVNRMIHINCEVNTDDVIEYGLKNNWREEVIGFLKWRPSLIYTSPSTDAPFASPRAYEFLSQVLTQSKEIEPEIVCGIIGAEAGAEFLSYIEVYNELPDLDDVLAGKPFKLIKEPSFSYAFLSGLAIRVSTAEHIERFFEILKQFSDELNVMAVKMILSRDIKELVRGHRNFKDWSARYREVIL
jgi:hypothetical protein